MKEYELIELGECPICHGTGVLEEENGWCFYVACTDCDSHTAEIKFKTEADKETAARKAIELWNMGKVIHTGIGE